MFTETETKRIRSFMKQYHNLGRVADNLRERLWYQTHGTTSPTKEAQIERRFRKVMNNQTRVYNKSVEYANALKRKYGLRVHSLTRPNLRNVAWARRRNVQRRTAERVMRTSPLVPNMLRVASRTAYPSPPRRRTLGGPTGFRYHEPW